MKFVREIKNWFFIKKTIGKEKLKPDGEWGKFRLRSNWYGRIYTVISLREEDLGEEEAIQNFKAMEKMKSINEYLASLDFSELIFPSIERIPESRSYLIVYSPIFNSFTAKNIVKIIIPGLIFIGALVWFVYGW